jgi:tetratricopeptide (TPR) repeat protein
LLRRGSDGLEALSFLVALGMFWSADECRVLWRDEGSGRGVQNGRDLLQNCYSTVKIARQKRLDTTHREFSAMLDLRLARIFRMPSKTRKARKSTRSAPARIITLAPKQRPASDTRALPAPQPWSRPKWWVCCLLVLATVAVYSAALKHPFVNFDDEDYIVQNPDIQQGLTGASVRWAFTTLSHSNWHPLTWLSHMVDYQLFGLNAGGHHFVSVLLHSLNAVLLYLFLSWVTGRSWRSLVVAALFALHPINVESVAWAAERKNVLSMFFFLATLIAYAWYARRPHVLRYLAVAAAFALALTAKPQVVTLPFVLVLLDYWPLQRIAGWQSPSAAFPAPQSTPLRLILEKIPLFAMSAASSLITMAAQQGAILPSDTVPLGARTVNAAYSYCAYLWKAIWPLHLAAFYPHWARFLAWWQIFLLVAILVSVTVLAWRKRSTGYWPVGWLWYLGTLVPMIGLIQAGQQGMADRYAYLPLIGIFTLVVWALADLAEARKIDARFVTALSAAILLAFSIFTARQVATWKSSYDLWAHALQVTENNYVADDFIGSSILLDTFKATGQRYSDRAAVYFRDAVRVNPEDTMGRLNLGADFHERGQLREAIQQYQIALGTAKSYDMLQKAELDMASAYEQLGDFENAHDYYTRALRITPKNSTILMNLGKLRMAQREKELENEAAQHPSAQTYWALGQLQRDLGHVGDAKRSLQRALQRDPKLTQAREALNALPADNAAASTK